MHRDIAVSASTRGTTRPIGDLRWICPGRRRKNGAMRSMPFVAMSVVFAVAMSACSSGSGSEPASNSGAPSSAASTSSSSASGNVPNLNESGAGSKLLKVTPFDGFAVVTANCANKVGADPSSASVSFTAIGANGKSAYVSSATQNHSGGDDVPYQGTFPVALAAGGWEATAPVQAYQITCSGPWTLKQESAESLPETPKGNAVTGVGGTVFRLPPAANGLRQVHLKADGDTNILLLGLDSKGEETDHMVNALDNYDSDVIVPEGVAYLSLGVNQFAKWTLTLS